MKTITIGKRLITAEDIAFVETFEPTSNPDFQSDRPFKGRIVLLNRDTVLTEMTPGEFSSAHGLHLLSEDVLGVNRAIAFRVEMFEPTDSFKPTKAYRTRLKWRDQDGNEQSKLLLAEPETVVCELSHRQPETTPSSNEPPKRPNRARRRPGRAEAARG